MDGVYKNELTRYYTFTKLTCFRGVPEVKTYEQIMIRGIPMHIF